MHVLVYRAEMLFCIKQIPVHNQQSEVLAVDALSVGTLTWLMTAACRLRTVDAKATTIDLTAWRNVRLTARPTFYKVDTVALINNLVLGLIILAFFV